MSGRGSPMIQYGGYNIPGGSGYLPSVKQMTSQFAVNLPNQWEAVRWSLYDSISYPAAGTNGLTFFQNPIGQPGGFGGGNKTLSDTNMVAAGQLPAMQMFWAQGLEIDFQPTTPTVAAGMPSAFGAQAADTLINDAYIVTRSGNIVFTVGSKQYCEEAPLYRCPPQAGFAANGALSDATTAAAASQSRIGWAGSCGKPYTFDGAALSLISNQNFKVVLGWPEGVQQITNPGRIFVRLTGFLYRAAQ